MDYPQWTLLGMGLSILGALVALAFALLAQSPGLVNRLGLGGARLDLRIRTFTSYAFALLLLSIGFFLAGIPVDDGADSDPTEQPMEEEGAGQSTSASSTISMEGSVEESGVETPSPTAAGNSTPETGSFSGPPPTIAGQNGQPAAAPTRTAEAAGPPDTPEIPPPITDTPRPTQTPTLAPSPTPTETPSPTITPTPITGETALVSSGGSTIWIVRSPGGQNLVLVRDGDTVLLMPGHANQAGQLWREIRTVEGVLGWIQEIFLDYGE